MDSLESFQTRVKPNINKETFMVRENQSFPKFENFLSMGRGTWEQLPT